MLLMYFTNLDVADLESFDQDDLEYVALPEHKLLMAKFSQRLQIIFKERKQFAHSATLSIDAISWKLDSISELAHKTSTKDLLISLPVLAMEKSEFDMIDISGKDLLDDDLPFISHAFSATDTYAQILDLHGNKFGSFGAFSQTAVASYAAVEKLIECGKFKFVDVSDCTLTRFSHRKFIHNMCRDKNMERFIWIPRWWMKGMKWTSGVFLDEEKEDESLILKILDEHTKFYKLRDSLIVQQFCEQTHFPSLNGLG
eukprot:TRINITY_DN6367_c0_g1_i11.p1 TRINITY_DN6367_c0_g1~~TRINITY_DN6367_c0_g1_i11.p1  ORF type:complete len:256 (-),score=64.52 TRINITY_DN6367_c0_g1_i11:1128-1895(-)